MWRTLVLGIILALGCLSTEAQPPIRLFVTKHLPADSVDLQYYGKKHFLRGATTLLTLNTGVWSFDRFIKHGDYSYISFHTIKENFKHGFYWDNDELPTNMFMHPYHGNLYFNIGRANGFNFWQSSLFAFSGSFMWEFFMECEYPSTNDIIATPVGGMALGEVMFRASDLVLNDESRGWQRFGREAAAFLISPMRGVTRILNGDAWRHRSTTGRQFGIPNIVLEYSAGVRILEFKKPFLDTGVGYTSELNIEYGDRFEVVNAKPYDYFTFRLDLNIHSSQPVLGQLNIMGRLIGCDLVDKGEQKLNVGLYQHFDYYDSDTISSVAEAVPYQLAVPACFGGGIMYRGQEKYHWAFDAFAHANAVILGGVLSDHYHVDMRDYNMGSGFSIKSGINLVFNRDRFSFSAIYDYYRLFTWKGQASGEKMSQENYHALNAQGNPSATSFMIGETRAAVRLFERLYLVGSFSIYHRSTHYNALYPPVSTTTTATRLMLSYKF
ncbi:MAG: DUF3943 domain-containing protein [Bacteroidales bacterium]|nr:DUF3943 domain-containing protein [Bacteroidales bacterium]